MDDATSSAAAHDLPPGGGYGVQDGFQRLLGQDHLRLRLVEVFQNLVLPSPRVVLRELRDERHRVGHVHRRVPVLRGLEEVLQLVGIQIVHEPHLREDLLDLEQRVGGAAQSQVPPDGVGVALALPSVLATHRRLLLPVGQQVLDVFVARLDALDLRGGGRGGSGEGGKGGTGGRRHREGGRGDGREEVTTRRGGCVDRRGGRTDRRRREVRSGGGERRGAGRRRGEEEEPSRVDHGDETRRHWPE
mmetsp:Transcript_22059/g.47335  ORF Transcript_22059/g.47335 Transcript_22059/m.47335 type:complete len:246 (+) Transcript_22059:306-1043(+)